MRANKAATGTVALMAVFTLMAARVQAQWEVQYNANSLVMPENNGMGWVYYNNDPGNRFQRGFVNNTLWVNTMPPGDPWSALVWRNTTGHFDFNAGFVMEARLKMIRATNNEPRWGGACIYSVSSAGYNMGIDVDPDKVILGSIFNYTSFAMNTTDAFHTYRAEARNNQGKLYVDGVLRLQMALASDNPSGWLSFGDQG
ncbi:MAG: hypothetical protein U0S12_03765 [Fimbriimonadales bacterium]